MTDSASLALGGTSSSLSDPYVLLSAALGVVLATTLGYLHQHGEGLPVKRGLPIIGSWAFFTHRYHFLEEGVKRIGNLFVFNILNHKVFAVSGPEGRKIFFGNKDLLFKEGYDILFGGGPELTDISEKKTPSENTAWFSKRIATVLRKEKLAKTLPLMFSDLERLMAGWGTHGIFNPFEDIYDMVFQLTIRAASCREIADDPAAVKKVTSLYWNMEHGSTPTAILLPWFPSKARSLRVESTREMYNMIKAVTDDRRASQRTEEDALQVLLDEGDSDNDIAEFVMLTLFAGIINTGIMSSWMTLYFHTNPEWKKRAIAEIRSLLDKYATRTDGSLSQKLAQLPPQVWEEELQTIDLCLRETIRVVLTGSLLRLNPTSDLVISGHKIPRGAFLTSPMSSVHHNENIYPEPFKWDPSRFERGEDKKETYGFVGWGVGRHPCLGMRFAKMEVKVILALFLMQYEYEVVDASGHPATELPPPDRDNLHQTPPVKPVFVKYRRIEK